MRQLGTKRIPVSIRLQPALYRRMILRLGEVGLSTTGYLHSLIEADLASRGRAELVAEVGLTTAVLVRQLIEHVYADDAKAIEEAASRKAKALLEQARNPK